MLLRRRIVPKGRTSGDQRFVTGSAAIIVAARLSYTPLGYTLKRQPYPLGVSARSHPYKGFTR